MQEIPMMSIVIRRPIDVVFGFVMDISQTSRWRPRMSDVTWLTDGEPRVGSRFRVVVRMLGIPFRFDPELTLWDPPRAVSYRQVTGPVLTDSHMEWSPIGSMTRFAIGGTPTAGNLPMRVLGSLFVGPLLRENHHDLLRLKAILETG